jgi:hypothetical protein
MPKGKHKMSKRGAGIMSVHDYKPKSSMSLEGEHAVSVKEHPVGHKTTFKVTATKTSHNMNSESGKMAHSARYEVNKVEADDNEPTDAKETANDSPKKPMYVSKQSREKD